MQPTHYLLIDYENLQPNLAIISNLSFIRVIAFVGATQKAIVFDFAYAMQRLGNRAMYIKSKTSGSNALDFHIVFYLGILVKRDPNAYFHIISNDTGFDPLIQHLRDRRLRVHRSARIEDLPFLPKTITVVEQPSTPPVAVQPAAQALSETNSVQSTVDIFVQQVIEHLKRHPFSRPATLNRLRKHLISLAKQQLSLDEIENVTAMLFTENLISLEEGASQRLRYHF